jgi:hypothetical protein
MTCAAVHNGLIETCDVYFCCFNQILVRRSRTAVRTDFLYIIHGGLNTIGQKIVDEFFGSLMKLFHCTEV